MHSLVFDLSVILISTAVLCIIAVFAKQPLILAYITAGILLGPEVLNVIPENEFFSAISSVGIVLLLYLIGLELKPKKFFPKVYKTSLMTFGPALICGAFGGIMYLMGGFSPNEILYLSIALFFSSTVVVMKKLVESKDVKPRVFEACIGVLLLQDIIAVFLLVILNSEQWSGGLDAVTVLQFFAYGSFIFGLAWLLQKWFLPFIFGKIASRNDLVLLIGLAWCFFFAELAEVMGLSREIGAFVAGLSITSLPVRRVKAFMTKSETIRDFFIVLFFFMLGAGFKFDNLERSLPVVVLAVVCIVVIKPIMLYFLSRMCGYGKNEGKEISLRLGQMSEFSIIIAAFGVKLGQIDTDFLNVIQLVLFATIVLSSYIVHYAVPKLHKKRKKD